SVRWRRGGSDGARPRPRGTRGVPRGAALPARVDHRAPDARVGEGARRPRHRAPPARRAAHFRPRPLLRGGRVHRGLRGEVPRGARRARGPRPRGGDGRRRERTAGAPPGALSRRPLRAPQPRLLDGPLRDPPQVLRGHRRHGRPEAPHPPARRREARRPAPPPDDLLRDGRAGARRRLHRVRVRAQLRLQILAVHLADDPGHRPPDHHLLPARWPLEPDRDRTTLGLRDETVEPVRVVLETIGLTKFFGMVRAAEDLSLTFQEGELVGIVGPNGSGKTTLLNVITGYVKPDRGRIRYQGKDITGLSPRAVADLGIARSFQMPQLYLSLTVLENLVLALAIRAGRAREFWAPLERVDRR